MLKRIGTERAKCQAPEFQTDPPADIERYLERTYPDCIGRVTAIATRQSASRDVNIQAEAA